jgi:hypothetical protein
MTVREDLARAFHDTQSFKWDPIKGFTLASGQTSPFYVDCRSLMAYPGSRQLVGHLAHDALAGVTIDCLGGLDNHLGLWVRSDSSPGVADLRGTEASQGPWTGEAD